MIYFQNTTDFYMAGPTAVMLGKFDGVHRGHQKLMKQILLYQKKHPGSASAAFVLSARDENKILTDEEQKEVFEQAGITCLIRCPFIPEIYTMTPEEFIRKILVEKLHAAYIAVGTDFRFGHNRAGSAQTLKDAAKQLGFTADIVEKEMWQDQEISSTFIRDTLQQGNMELVAELMGRPYQIRGNVIHGKHLGTEMGMPTANLVPDMSKVLPPNGVYYSRIYVESEDRWYNSVSNIGSKPTVDGTFTGVETHAFDIDRQLYGEKVKVEILSYKRPEKKFESVEALKKQIAIDIEDGMAYFKKAPMNTVNSEDKSYKTAADAEETEIELQTAAGNVGDEDIGSREAAGKSKGREA